MDSSPALRIALVALAFATWLIVPAGCGSEDASGESRLRIELSPIPPPLGEVIVYVGEAANTSERAGGHEQVTLECLDRTGRVVLRGRHRWPFRSTDGGVFEAHIHQRLRRGSQRSIASCRLVGTEGPLEGPVSVEGLG